MRIKSTQEFLENYAKENLCSSNKYSVVVLVVVEKREVVLKIKGI